MKKIALHWQIIIGLFLGLAYGIFASNMGLNQFTTNWISPFGTIFINLLKLIAMPLVLSSLITGVASLSDIKKLSDFADLSSDELIGGFDEIKGKKIRIDGYLEEFSLSRKEADELIMSAREIAYK